MLCKPIYIANNWKELKYELCPFPKVLTKPLATDLSFSIFRDAALLPARWDIIAEPNILLSRQYLAVLQNASPANMECHFIGMYKNNNLCGIALAQYINLSNIDTFADRKEHFNFKDYLIKKFSSHVLIIGNNTITGQNAYLHSGDITRRDALEILQQSLRKLKSQYQHNCINIDLVAIKDFTSEQLPLNKESTAAGYYNFSAQPNMVFQVKDNWKNTEDYLADLSTKYRTQYNRARKKAQGIEKRRLTGSEIRHYNRRIHELYLTVAGNAPFNTFYLPEDHFEVFKLQLGEDFVFNGYFLDEQLIGFSTLIKNEDKLEAYFLGYDAALQKEKMLYLNMLYDMIVSAITQKSRLLILGRSAMEIKSSVGARAEQVHGFIKHTNPMLNMFMANLFQYFEPKTEWKERNPFKQG